MTNIAHIEERNGKASFFSRREKNPFCHLGEVVPDDITSKADVMKLARLDNWNVRHVDLETLLPTDMSTETDYRMVIRDNPYFDGGDDPKTNLLGMVKSRHEIVSNEEMFEFAEKLLIGGRYETAGSLDGGRRIFLSMALDAQIVIDESGINDDINTYLVLSNSHDGSTGLTAAVTPIRVVCTNTLNYALKDAQQKITIRHTKSVQERMQMAVQTLKLATNYETHFKSDAETLLAEPVSDNEFFKIMNAAFPIPTDPSKTQVKNWTVTMDELNAIWNSGTVEGAGIKNTKWGAFQTLSEWDQYTRKVTKGNEEAFWQYGAGLTDLSRDRRTELHDLVATW